MRRLLWLSALLLGCASISVGAEHQLGRVAHVVDGDTLIVLFGQRRVRVGLVEIDAPEQAQSFGHRSRQSLIQICGGELAMVEARAADRNGRTLARVTCNGISANAEQVRRGMAHVSERDAPADSPLHAMQAEARAARRGLWVAPTPVPPWEWRRLNQARAR